VPIWARMTSSGSKITTGAVSTAVREQASLARCAGTAGTNLAGEFAVSKKSFAGVAPDRIVPAGAMLDHIGWILAAGLTGAAVAALLALSTPQQFRAEALVQIGARDAATQGVARGAKPAPFDIGLLKSRAMVGPVVENLHLDISAEPLRAPLLGSVAARFATPGRFGAPWPANLGYAWGAQRLVVDKMTVPEHLFNVPLLFEVLPEERFVLRSADAVLLEGRVGEPATGNGVELLVTRVDALPGTRFTMTRHDLAAMVSTIAGELKVSSEEGEAGTARITWQNPDPKLAAALVNGVANSYISGQTAQRSDDAASTLAFLSSQLPRVQGELERAEAALTRYRSRSGSMQPSQDAQSYLNGSIDYQKQIAALKMERTGLLQRFTTESNEVRTVDNKITQMMRERKELDARMQNLSMSERESVSLTRDVKVAEDMYMTLRNKVQELSLIVSDHSSQVRVVDNAVVPMSPVGPGPWPLTAGGGLLGLCLGIACVSVRQRTKQTVASANEAEALLGMPMLGDIAYSREQQELERLIEAKVRLGIAAGFAAPGAARLEGPEPGQALEALDESYPDFIKHLLRQGLHDRYLLARSAPHSLAVEGLRSVRAALHFGLRSAADGVVAVTSPAPGAGKTFAAINLAVLFAEAGQRVLLIDADMRRGKVASWFDQGAEGGLAEILAGQLTLAAAVRPTVVSGLSILTTGATPHNPSELLMRPALAECLRLCASRFDLVIVDTPPVMAVADATLVANIAGSTLVVVRADQTPPDQVEETLKRLARSHARLLGGILNGVTARRSNRAEFNSINPYLGMPEPAPSVPKLERAAGVERMA